MFHLLSYSPGGGGSNGRAAIRVGDDSFDVAQLLGDEALANTAAVIDDWAASFPKLDQAAAAIASGENRAAPLGSIELLAPCGQTGQIFGAGGNYTDHLEAMVKKLGGEPTDPRAGGGRPWFFVKPGRSCVVGHGAQVKRPDYSKMLDYELELGVVIGRPARNVSADQALDYVCGYTVTNDLSARDMMRRSNVPPDGFMHFDWLGQKGFDGSCPLGPWITPAAYIPDPQALALRLEVNGEVRQESNTSRMVFSVAEQIAEISARLTLNPGDIILTGTPAGVGMESGQFLAPGDVVRIEIERIGMLETRIV